MAGEIKIVKDLVSLASKLQKLFLKEKWRFCFIGGLALQVWGEMRLTRDIDVSLFTGFGEEEKYISRLLKLFSTRVENPLKFALKNRVLLLQSPEKIAIDIALAGFPFEERVMERAKDVVYFRKISLRVCSAEDLVVYKAFADRPKDWVDLEGILFRQKNRLDWEYVQTHLSALCEIKEAPHIVPKILELKKKT